MKKISSVKRVFLCVLIWTRVLTKEIKTFMILDANMAFPPSKGSAMTTHFKLTTMTTALAAVFILSACGGGGGSSAASGSSSSSGSSGSYTPINVSIAAPSGIYTAGNTISLMGAANTGNTIIKSLNWSISPSATLSNADCSNAVKNSQTYTTNNQGASGTSNWSCPVTISANSAGASNAVYTLSLTAVDDKGNSQSSTQQITVAPSTNAGNTAVDGLTASAGNNFTASVGANPLHCSATSGKSPYTYQWSVTNSGGFNLPLSSYTTADTSFTAPSTTNTALLSFNCQVTDASGFTANSLVSATVNGAAVTPLAVNAGSNFTAAVGSTNNLHCDATGGKAPYSFQWVVSNNGGYNFPLSAYNAADTTFTAPAVTSATSMSFTCRATDSNNNTTSSTVSATVNPGTAATSALVANIVQPGTAAPGQTITLDGSSTGWFDASSGKASTGPTPTYAWKSNDPNVVIANVTSAKTTATIPSGITTATTESFTLNATAGDSSSSSSVNVLVDPYGPLALAVAPSANAVKGNTSATFVATATSPTGSASIYYQWSQISGAPLSLGGATTATLGVVPPLVAAGTTATYTFRVAVGYQPITASYPGLYFTDVTLTVTP